MSAAEVPLISSYDWQHASSFPETVLRWAGRSALRAVGVEAYTEAHKHLEARGSGEISERSLVAGALSIPFPLGMGIRQSRIGDIPGVGLAAQVIAGALFDMPANTVGLIPFVGHGSRILYQGIAAGVSEMLPSRRMAQKTRR